jgi:hypothetical protein
MADTPRREGPNYVAIGCLMIFAGFFSGGMIAVFVAKGVDIVRRCTPPEGLPACDWHIFMLSGGLLGAATLPSLVLWRLRRGGTEDKRGED